MTYDENHLTELLERVGRAYHEVHAQPEAPGWDELPPVIKMNLKQTLLPVVLATLGADEEIRPRIKSAWSLTVDGNDSSINTQVFVTEQECLDSLRRNYAEDFEGDDAALIDELTERQGICFYIEEHSL